MESRMSAETSVKSKKKIILIVVVALLGAAAGSGATYALLHDDKQNNNQAVVASEEDFDPNASAVKLEEKIPDGTISPTAIVGKSQEYEGKEVKVRGRVVEMSANEYIIAGQEPQKAAGIKLDFGDSGVNPTEYVSSFADPNKNAPTAENPNPKQVGAVTVTGTVSIKSDRLTLTVKNISF
jgi:hypothetical protein